MVQDMKYKLHEVKDFLKPFYIEDFKKSDHLIIPMSGYGQNFEWFRTIRNYEEDYNFSKLWIRDLSNAYWHGRYPELGTGVHILSKFIKEKIKESKAKKVMMLGLSMGGYGSILFGCLCDVDLVLSFSGQTYLPPERREKYKLYSKWEDLDVNEEDIDLKKIFGRYNKMNKTIYKLFYGERNKKDKKFARHLSTERGVELFPVNTHRHNSVGISFKSGLVGKIIEEFLK